MAKYQITNTLTNCTNSNSATQIDEGSNYVAEITPSTLYSIGIGNVKVLMNGVDISDQVVSYVEQYDISGNVDVVNALNNQSTPVSEVLDTHGTPKNVTVNGINYEVSVEGK